MPPLETPAVWGLLRGSSLLDLSLNSARCGFSGERDGIELFGDASEIDDLSKSIGVLGECPGWFLGQERSISSANRFSLVTGPSCPPRGWVSCTDSSVWSTSWGFSGPASISA